MLRVILLLIVYLCCNTGGDIMTTSGMKQVGAPESFRVRAILRFLGKAVRNRRVLLALPLNAGSFYSLLILFSWAPFSVVIPASAFTYVLGTVGAKYILKEEVSQRRWLGVGMVSLGVALVLAAG